VVFHYPRAEDRASTSIMAPLTFRPEYMNEIRTQTGVRKVQKKCWQVSGGRWVENLYLGSPLTSK